jgi:predicted dehydrogenase
MAAANLKVGIAGYGVVGQRRRVCADQHPDLTVTAVCDRRMEGEGSFADGVRYYQSYQRLLESETLDILFVCLTNDIAAEVTIAGLERGLHVFCEKPPGRDLADIARVVACEKRHPGLRLKYGFNHRYHDSVRDALALVQSGELGRVLNLRGVYGKSTIIDFRSPDHWRTKRAVAGGGILLDQGIHMVDLIRLFGGEFEDIHAFISNEFWHHDVEDNAYALMRSKKGVVAMLHSTATQWRHRFNLEITLSAGMIQLAGILTGSKSYGAETLTVTWANPNDGGDPKEQTTRYNSDPSWADEVAEFTEAVLTGKPIVNGSSDEALKTMEMVYRIYCADSGWRDRWQLSDQVPEV